MPKSGRRPQHQSRRFDLLSITSALPRTTDVSGLGRHFAFVPNADISTLLWSGGDIAALTHQSPAVVGEGKRDDY
jgi:hypothetical protein